ncbi:Hypothetical protein, putative, partial [Bodo saltans]
CSMKAPMLPIRGAVVRVEERLRLAMMTRMTRLLDCLTLTILKQFSMTRTSLRLLIIFNWRSNEEVRYVTLHTSVCIPHGSSVFFTFKKKQLPSK